MDASYDFIIVGGGSAGCVLANRLSQDPANRVLVLEAGRPDWSWDVFIHMPAALAFPIGSRFYDWKYESEPEPHMGGRRVYHARGKVLGGSCSVNGMIFQRGNPLDYERWASGRGHGDLGPRALPALLQAHGELPGRAGRRSVPRPRRPARAGARTRARPALRRVLRRRAGGGLPAHRGRERLSPGGLRRLRPQRAQRPPAVRRARLPASGDGPPQPRRQDVRPRPRRSCSRATRAIGVEYALPDAAHAPGAGRRGDPLRRRDQLAAAAPALRRGRGRRAARRSASTWCPTCPAWGRTCRTTSRSTSSTRHASRSRWRPTSR